MPEIHDCLGDPNMDTIEKAVSKIVIMLDKHNYSSKALYVAQEFLIDELLDLENELGKCKSNAKRLRKKASEIAQNAKQKYGNIPSSVKEKLGSIYREADNNEHIVEVLKHGRWLLRYVGDGIAWHAFGHNRRNIRALGSKQPIRSFSRPKGIDYERRSFRAIRHLGREWFPLMHDLTNCIRTADFSVFRDEQLYRIFELKVHKSKSRKKKNDKTNDWKSSRAIRQQDRLERIFKFMESKDLGYLDPSLEGGRALDSRTFERHNFEIISKIMQNARSDGYGFESPEPGILYFAWDISNNPIDKGLKLAAEKHPEIFSSTFTFRSLNPRFEELHQSMPVTAMEYSAQDILDLLFGRIGINTFLNFNILENECKRNEIPLIVQGQPKGGFSIVVDTKPYKGEIREGLWNRLMLEALSLESFIDLVKSIVGEYSKE